MKKFILLIPAFLFLHLTAFAQPKNSSKIKTKVPAGFIAAYNIKVHMNNISFDTYVSTAGVMAKQSTNHSGMPESLERGIFIDYTTDSVFKIDYLHSLYYNSTLKEADNVLSVEHAIAERSSVSFDSVAKQASYVPGKLKTLKSTKMAGKLKVSHKSYISPTQKTWHLYYAKIRKVMPSAAPKKRKKGAAQKGWQTILMPDAENILVRAEVEINGKKEVVMDLDEAKQMNVPVSTFSIPVHFAPAKLRMSTQLKVNSLKPGPGFKSDRPIESDIASRDVTIDHGIGPVIANPSVYVLFWGTRFILPTSMGAVQSIAASMQDIVSKEYTAPLSFYGVNEGKVAMNIFVNEDPPSSAGGGGSGAVVGKFLIDQIFQKQLPKIWWSFGENDPLYMVLVTADQVDHNGWCGYHFVVPTFYDAFVPFPFNYLMHEELPYAFAEIPNNAMNLGLEDVIQRQTICPSQTARCEVIRSFDAGTYIISHEYVEVCTDPTPFFSWVDAGRGIEGEIADICESSGLCLDFPTTPGSFSRVGSTIVSTYWSVPANGCVPGSLTSIVIKEPLDNAEVMWQAGGGKPTLFALASNAIDGDLTNIRWTDEGGSVLGNGVNIQSTPLSLGPHTITATAFNAAMVPLASAITHINVTAKEAEAIITSPNSSTLYASGDIINFRGSAFDLQDGDLNDSQLSWFVDGVFIGTGKFLSQQINKTGFATITLSATNSAGLKSSVAVIIKLGPPNPPDQITYSIKIVAPLDKTIFFNPDDVITFRAIATRSDGTPVPESFIRWKDDIDGNLGTGSTITHQLSGGPGGPIMHNVTVSILFKSIVPTHLPKDMITIQKGRVL